MQFIIKVKLNCHKQSLEKFTEKRYFACLVSKEHKEANQELIPLLSKSFSTAPHKIKIKSGLEKDEKIIEAE